jgi:DNA-binding NarL/FixJ family response regulator
MHDEQLYAIRALKSGAQGYVMKRENPEMLIDALRKVAGGRHFREPEGFRHAGVSNGARRA